MYYNPTIKEAMLATSILVASFSGVSAEEKPYIDIHDLSYVGGNMVIDFSTFGDRYQAKLYGDLSDTPLISDLAEEGILDAQASKAILQLTEKAKFDIEEILPLMEASVPNGYRYTVLELEFSHNVMNAVIAEHINGDVEPYAFSYSDSNSIEWPDNFDEVDMDAFGILADIGQETIAELKEIKLTEMSLSEKKYIDNLVP
jgi:hypothetical protein